MISVAMATFNSEKYIKKQLDSILNQSVAVDEVIIVDDCSSDKTVELLKDYIESRKCINWKVYCHESNQGYIKTFREALRYSNGDIIITCDHDDMWMHDKVEMIQNAFSDNAEVLYLATSFVLIDVNDNEIPVKQKRNRANNNLIKRKILKGTLNKMDIKDVAIYNITPGCTCALASKLRDIYISGEDMALPHDWALALIAACKNGLYYYDVVTTKYRLHENNTIGLGHVNDYTKRVNNVCKNYVEKCEEEKIIQQYSDTNVYALAISEIRDIFGLRQEYLKTGQLHIFFMAFYKSLKYGKLYESLLMDFITVVRKGSRK